MTQQDGIHRMDKSNCTQTVYPSQRNYGLTFEREDEPAGFLTVRRRPWPDSLSWYCTLPGNRVSVHSACPPSMSERVNTSEAPQQGHTTAQQPSAGSLRNKQDVIGVHAEGGFQMSFQKNEIRENSCDYWNLEWNLLINVIPSDSSSRLQG